MSADDKKKCDFPFWRVVLAVATGIALFYLLAFVLGSLLGFAALISIFGIG